MAYGENTKVSQMGSISEIERTLPWIDHVISSGSLPPLLPNLE